MELIHVKRRKSASLHGGVCFVEDVAGEAKLISNLHNLGNEVNNFDGGKETWMFPIFFQYLVHNQKRADQKKKKKGTTWND